MEFGRVFPSDAGVSAACVPPPPTAPAMPAAAAAVKNSRRPTPRCCVVTGLVSFQIGAGMIQHSDAGHPRARQHHHPEGSLADPRDLGIRA